jgi:hypothetical protein
METDRTEPPASEFDKPFITQQESQQLTSPVVPQVSFTYRFAANSNRIFTQLVPNYILSSTLFCPTYVSKWCTNTFLHESDKGVKTSLFLTFPINLMQT